MSDTEVIKIGGSVLAMPGGMRIVRGWLDRTRRAGSTRLILLGGGPVVDGLRLIDRRNPLPTDASHWAAIDLMDANARLAPHYLSHCEVTTSIANPHGDFAFACRRWVREQEPNEPGERLAAGWETTSDAIAARLAAVLRCSATIVKCSIEKTYQRIAEAAADGVVDPETPRVAHADRAVRVVSVNDFAGEA